MKEDKFIKDNARLWESFENTLKRIKSKGFKAFESNELDEFIANYNRICGHLSYSRTYFGGTTTAVYLNNLVASAHNYIYTTKTSRVKELLLFLFKGFPYLVKVNTTLFTVSFSLFMIGFLISFGYTLASPDNAIAFIPQNVIDSVNFDGGNGEGMGGSLMSSFIFTNNIKVGFAAFALGITLGLGTSYVLIFNGFMLGSIAALAFHANANLKFWSLILPHGILELFAIFVCGAAGLMLGYSLINPGEFSRKDSLILRGKTSLRLVLGTIPIFVIAGLIEGFVTPSSLSAIGKLVFAGITLVLLAVYIVLPNRKKPSTR